jgi:hypothetical protein
MDLKKILDAKTRYVFLARSGLSYAFAIVHVDGPFLYFTSQTPLTDPFDNGHFLATDGQGIVRFEKPVVESLTTAAEKRVGLKLHRLDFGNLDFSITNRRVYERYEFKKYIPITFHVFGNSIVAQLLNIGEGGLRMRADTPIKKDVLCHFEIALPGTELKFCTDGLVVYIEPEDDQKQFVIGVQFLVPEFADDAAKQNYLNAKVVLKDFTHLPS